MCPEQALLLTMTTEGCAGSCLEPAFVVALVLTATGLDSSSSLSSSMPSESPSTSLTVSSIVACLAFTVSILHLEWSDAICSWYPRIFWASSCQNIIPTKIRQFHQSQESVVQSNRVDQRFLVKLNPKKRSCFSH